MSVRWDGHLAGRGRGFLDARLAVALLLVAMLGPASGEDRVMIKAPRETKREIPATGLLPGALERRAWLGAVAEHEGPGPVLWVQLPVADRVFHGDRIRFAGCTEPGGRVSVNGRAVDVYPSGAFAGMISLRTGRNPIRIIAVRGGSATVRRIEVVRSPAAEPLPSAPLALGENRPMRPDGPHILTDGDVLNVQCEASPGARAWFRIGARATDYPMRELAPERGEASHPGFFRGSYVVQPDDAFVQAPIRIFVSDRQAAPDDADDSDGRVRLRTPGASMSPRRRVLSALAPGYLTTGGRYARRTAVVLADDTGLYTEPRTAVRFTSVDTGARLRITGRRDDMFRLDAGGIPLWVMQSKIRLDPLGAPLADTPIVRLPEMTPASGDRRDVLLAFPLRVAGGGAWTGALPFRVETADMGTTLVLTLWGARAEPIRLDIADDTTTGGHALRLLRHMRASGFLKTVECRPAGRETLQWRVTLVRPPVWGFDLRFERGQCMLRISAPPLPGKGKPLAGVHVFVDAGHGGADSGAVGPAGLYESDVNLALAERVARLLRAAGARVSQTRRGDDFVSLDDRTERIRESGADLLVSIHNNSIGETSDPLASRGPLMFYFHGHSYDVARRILRELPVPDAVAPSERGVRYQSLRLTRACHQMPAVLIEGLFLSNPEDEMLLLDPGFLDSLGEAIYKGIVSYMRETGDARNDSGSP